MTSKQRAYLKSLAMTMDPIFQIGKSSLTPENTAAIAEALEARELIKISVLQNCMDDPNEIAQVVAERTRSQVVQVIGKKIVLYKEGKDNKKKIELPKAGKSRCTEIKTFRKTESFETVRQTGASAFLQTGGEKTNGGWERKEKTSHRTDGRNI